MPHSSARGRKVFGDILETRFGLQAACGPIKYPLGPDLLVRVFCESVLICPRGGHPPSGPASRSPGRLEAIHHRPWVAFTGAVSTCAT